MFGSLSLGGVVHLKTVKRGGREAALGEKESDREDSARVDFDHFCPKSLAMKFELDKDGDASLATRIRVVQVEDFVGFSVLSLESDPMFFLSMSFLDRDNVIVVYEFSDSIFLGFPVVFGKAFGGEKAVSIPGGKRDGGRIIREDSVRAQLILLTGVPLGDWRLVW